MLPVSSLHLFPQKTITIITIQLVDLCFYISPETLFKYYYFFFFFICLIIYIIFNNQHNNFICKFFVLFGGHAYELDEFGCLFVCLFPVLSSYTIIKNNLNFDSIGLMWGVSLPFQYYIII